MNDLSQSQRKQLQRLNDKLRTAPHTDSFVQPCNKTLTSILRWAQLNYVLPADMTAGPDVVVSRAWIDTIDRALISQGFAPLDSERRGDRLQQAKQSLHESKHLADAPTQHRVLVGAFQPVNQDALFFKQETHWQIQDCAWHHIDLTRYQCLIAIENLSVFYNLESLAIEWPESALIVYRGDERYHRGYSQLLQHWAKTDKSCRAIVDLDPFSLRMVQTGPYTHVAAPTLERFHVLANAQHAPSQQYTFASHLEARGTIAPYIQLMKQKQCGLKQEWMHEEQLQWLTLY